ncbi:cyanophycinase [Parasphingopyxis sp. CP4]|uniref:cyanophycinase n=1 Tax=Parasphingopyxis sp. CP4 TaxID=2724527 RepID=UPI0021042BB3|nr:cyanophycinase [Parasphingopyxis sp. CP4]
MIFLRSFAGFLLALAVLFSGPAQADNGRLLIVGGGLLLENEAVYRALIDNRPEDSPGIAIIAAAGVDGSARATTFAGHLMHHGVDPEVITIVALATVDDPDTPDIDEGDWVANAANPQEIAKIENAGAIWFTGGDQARLNRTLVRPGGIDSPMLAAIRARLAAGAIIGGTSAGAAAMSSPMIARGGPFEALFGPVGDTPSDETNPSEPLVLMQGLRFFAPFTIDQHLMERARLGRLARATARQPGPARLGIGIDEDTALLVNLFERRGTVIGRGAVTVLDARDAVVSADAITGIRLSRLHDGDRIGLNSFEVTPSDTRLSVADRDRIFGGLWPTLEPLQFLESEAIGFHTSEMRRGTTIRVSARLSYAKRTATFTLSGDSDTRYWRRDSDYGWNGTLTGVRLSLTTETAE